MEVALELPDQRSVVYLPFLDICQATRVMTQLLRTLVYLIILLPFWRSGIRDLGGRSRSLMTVSRDIINRHRKADVFVAFAAIELEHILT
jgi:hypothetical protein